MASGAEAAAAELKGLGDAASDSSPVEELRLALRKLRAESADLERSVCIVANRLSRRQLADSDKRRAKQKGRAPAGAEKGGELEEEEVPAEVSEGPGRRGGG